MRIVFMGTPAIAVPSLRALLESPWEVAAVFSQPDRPRGRGRIVQACAVKEAADGAGVPTVTPERLRDPEAVETLRHLRPDAIVVNAYAQKVPPEVLSLPPLGCINVHPSLLPRYRGGAPIRWTLFNGEPRTGVTTIFMAEGWDDGDMILQEAIPVGGNETYGELSARLADLGADLLRSTLELLEQGRAPRVPQNHDEATWAPILKREDETLDFSQPSTSLHNRARGLSPVPGARTTWGHRIVKVLRTAVSPDAAAGAPGEIICVPGKKGLFVGTGRGILEITELQLEGKKPMSGWDFVNGYRPQPGGKFGEAS